MSKMDFHPDTHQPDEGYSEDPISPSAPSSHHRKPAALSPLRSPEELPAWFSQHLANLPISTKTQIAMALLDDLPTSVIAQIVNRLSPRLYIDFVRHLPPEICLKILGHLDPVSLLNVGRSCRSWYTLILDQKLWRRLYLLEGWKILQEDMLAEEESMRKTLEATNTVASFHKIRQSRYHHASNARPAGAGRNFDEDTEMSGMGSSGTIAARMGSVMAPQQRDPSGSSAAGSSIFRPPPTPIPAPTPARTSSHMDWVGPVSPPPKDAAGTGNDSPSTNAKGKGKMVMDAYENDKARAPSAPELPPEAPSSLRHIDDADADAGAVPLRSTLWIKDSSRSPRINWKHLYNMRMRLETNWDLGQFTNFQLPHPDHPREGHRECIYTLQFDSKHLVSGSRDQTIRIWNMRTRRLVRPPLKGHSGSVLCLQFDDGPEEDLIVSGSSDSNVILWRFSTGEIIQVLTRAHNESVLNVRFDKRILVTCSKDKSIKVFNRTPLRYGDLGYRVQNQVFDPVAIRLKKYGMEPDLAKELPVKPPYTLITHLNGHGAAVNAVQIHGRHIVSASGDRSIKVWDWPDGSSVRQISEHVKGIACVQFDGRRIVSGSSDNLVKIFDAATGVEVASLRGHTSLVRTVQSGFGDLPYSEHEDELEARRIDQRYFQAVEQGLVEAPADGSRHRKRNRNAGSSRPEDITSFGAKIPPGGGGGKYGRIVSGSYDQNIIIWRRDKAGAWKAAHHLRQDVAAVLAAGDQFRGQATTAAAAAAASAAASAVSASAVSASAVSAAAVAAAAAAAAPAAAAAAAASAQTSSPPTGPHGAAPSPGMAGPSGTSGSPQPPSGPATLGARAAHLAHLHPLAGNHPGPAASGPTTAHLIPLPGNHPGPVHPGPAHLSLGPPPHNVIGPLASPPLRSFFDPLLSASLTAGHPASTSSSSSPAGPSRRPTDATDATTAAALTPQSVVELIDAVVPMGVAHLQHALVAFPGMLTHNSHIQAAIEREQSPIQRSQLRQVLSAAMLRMQLSQNGGGRQSGGAQGGANFTVAGSAGASGISGAPWGAAGQPPERPLMADGTSAGQDPAVAGPTLAGLHAATGAMQLHPSLNPQLYQPSGPNPQPYPPPGSHQQLRHQPAPRANPPQYGQQQPVSSQHQHHLHHQTHSAHHHGNQNNSHNAQPPPGPVPQSAQPVFQPGAVAVPPPPANAAPAGPPQYSHIGGHFDSGVRVFKLQFDARRIICCSQSSVIVGWDFCNGDRELEEASRFFASID